MRDEPQGKRPGAAQGRESPKKPQRQSVNPPPGPAGARPRPDRISPREPIYLASQLASICDVDLKTIHNWCDRNDDPEAPAELECFRTPGGHLRFRHSAVLRFLSRWGYPIPDTLLRDRPHVLLVEPDDAVRRRLVTLLGLVRPGEDATDDGEPGGDDGLGPMGRVLAEGTPAVAEAEASPDDTLGLWASARYYVHLWDDPYAALVALGERTGTGSPPDLAVLSLPMPGLDERAWIHGALALVGDHPLRFVLVNPETGPTAVASTEPSVVSVVARPQVEELRGILHQQTQQLLARMLDRPANPPGEKGAAGPRKRRIPIAPREPIFVASQVAHIWDVDLKTVHNWVERGDIEAFRTPGRHLRFRRRSLLHFLRRYNMAIPEDLVPQKPRVMIVDRDPQTAKSLTPALSELFDVVEQPDPVAALGEIGALCAGAGLIDAVVVSLPAEGLDDRRWVAALARHPDTRYTRVVVISGDDSRVRDWQSLGVIATVQRKSLDQVAPVLEKALGLNH